MDSLEFSENIRVFTYKVAHDGGSVSIPSPTGHPFRRKPATHSDANRPAIPTVTGHPVTV